MGTKKNRTIKTITLALPTATVQKIEAINQEKGWEFDQGMRRILGAGLGFLEMGELENAGADPDPHGGLVRRVIESESIIASLQFKLFESETANTNWELSSGAIATENHGLRETAFKQLERIDELTRTINQLRKENLELTKEFENRTKHQSKTSNLSIWNHLKQWSNRGK